MDIWTAKALTGMRILPGTRVPFAKVSDMVTVSLCTATRQGSREPSQIMSRKGRV